MTHDELLKKINWWKGAYVNRNNCKRCIKYLNTLRAVVELHKPWLSKHDDLVMCEHCCSEVYPCPTIQAIEKELA
jgi:hypothetical protein